MTEKLYHSSNAALVGYSLILAVLRTFNVKDEASRVMVAAPLLAFLTTHILYLNFYELDYGELFSLKKRKDDAGLHFIDLSFGFIFLTVSTRLLFLRI